LPRGVDVHVLSTPPVFYERDLRGPAALRRDHDAFAQVAAANPALRRPGRPPLQMPEMAARELELRAATRLRGAEIAATSTVDLDDKARPSYAKAQELDVPLFVHPRACRSSSSVCGPTT
jgi:predicted TIM-barrel fold metal-dependent hydrolase